MAKIIALIYPNPVIGAEVYQEIHELQNRGALDLIDVAEVEIKTNGKLKFENAMTMPLVGTSDGMFLPALIGLLFFHSHQIPNDKVEQTLRGISLDQKFIRELSEKAYPQNSVLFLYLRGDGNAVTLAKITQHGGQLLQMSLSLSQEEQLTQLFHGHPPGERNETLINTH